MGFFDGMPGDPNPTLRGWARVTEYLRFALWAPVKTSAALILLGIAVAEALLAPFLGAKFALASLATAACAVGYILAFAGVWIQWASTQVSQIYAELLKLHDEEVQKAAKELQKTQSIHAVPNPSSRLQ